MKKYTWLLKVFIPILVLTAMVVSFAGVPRWLHPVQHTPVAPPVADSGVTYTQEDENMLKQVIAVYAHMDSCREVYVEGFMDASDPADSTATLHNVFRFCKRGSEFYYQTGDVEMIALENIYISVSSTAKKIFVGPARKVIDPLHMPVDSLVKIWKGEHYNVVADVQQKQVSVRLLCNNHVTCKEYRYDYDPSTMVLKGVYMRLTNLNDPLNNAMDKEVSVSIKQWKENNIPQVLLRADSYLVQGKNGWQPVGAYADYSLISLF